MTRGRLAPSPTGLLHLGNAWAFWLAWLAARAAGGSIVLRMEDLDPFRSKPEYADKIIEDLLWLGLDWDFGPGSANERTDCRQSNNGLEYESALGRLTAKKLAYECFCTRRDLRDLAGAPQVSRVPYQHVRAWVGDSGAKYPGACRKLGAEERDLRKAAGGKFGWRMACPENYQVRITDLVWGEQNFCLGPEQDFLLRRSDGVWAYHLAVCIDDARQGVTQVVRGNDILESTACQLLLYDVLKLEPWPRYAHLPLLHDQDGNRLSKRQQSLSLDAIRQAGIEPEQVIGYLAWLAGLSSGGRIGARQVLASLRGGPLPWECLARPYLEVPADFCLAMRGL